MIHLKRKNNQEDFRPFVESNIKKVFQPKISDQPIICSISKNGNGSWTFTWTAGTAPFQIYLNGTLIDTVSVYTYTFFGIDYSETPPPLEITGAGNIPESEKYPSRILLQWRGNADAFEYLVETFISSSWVYRSRVTERGVNYYSYLTTALQDGEESLWRVTAMDSKLMKGTPLAFTLTPIRNPNEPDVSFSVSGGVLTIAEGS